jgi:hypothetical protein
MDITSRSPGSISLQKETQVGWTPLHWASSKGAAGAIECLIEQKAAVYQGTPDDNFTPVHEAGREMEKEEERQEERYEEIRSLN